MCRYCITLASHPSADRIRVLDLLALIERPDVLTTEATLHIAGALLAWTEPAVSRLRCDGVTLSEP